MAEQFSYKKKDYLIDDKGEIFEDKVFGSEVGKKDKDGKITIQTGVFKTEEVRISKSGEVYKKGILGGDKEKVGETKTGCLLSSACVAARSLPDDCEELTTLRKFREEHIDGTPGGNAILQEYQVICGEILRWLEGCTERKTLYDDLYQRLVIGTVNLIRAEQFETAINHYQSIVRNYQAKARA